MKMSSRILLMAGAFSLLAACSARAPRPVAVVEGERFLTKGVSAYRNDELLTAATFFTKALAHYQGLDDRAGQLRSRVNLCEVALAISNLDAAERHLVQAEQLAVGDLAGYQPRLLLLRSSLSLARGDIAAARSRSEALLPEKLGGNATARSDEGIVREALVNRTAVAFALPGDEPLLWLERLAGVAKGDSAATARLERFRAAVAHRQGESVVAERHLQQALELCKTLPSRGCIAATLEEWGALLQSSDDLVGAQERYQRALAVRMALLDRSAASADLHQLAALSQRAGEPQRSTALSLWAQALGGSEAVDWNTLRRDVLPR